MKDENATRKEQEMDGFKSAKTLLCNKCGAILGVITSINRIRIGNNEWGAVDASLPVDVTCACGEARRLESYDECTGPLCEYPLPLAGK